MIGGTKWPSITSTWITRAPASITSATWLPSRAKSAERIDGATRGSVSNSFTLGNLADAAAYMARSIEPPQERHCMSSVWLIRAIVWCSPQLGHCETSSKRQRQ